MISYVEALRLVLAHVALMPAVETEVEQALGMVLARTVRATTAMPRFDQSAVDGYALQSANGDVRPPSGLVELEVMGEVAAGVRRVRRLQPGRAMRVFTGSPLPPGADAVVMQEDCEREGPVVRLRTIARPGQNVRRAGEECARGDELLRAGAVVTPPVIALLRTFGITGVRVHARPRVTVVTMGDELLGPGERLRPHAIHDANGPGIAAALRTLGVRSVKILRVSDDAAALLRTMRAALARADVLITVGGASVGDHDHVRATWQQLGIVGHFDRVAMKPGKPSGFGVAPRGAVVFALPGNPVAALVSFQLLVRPALQKMMGRPPASDVLARARLTHPIRHRPGRQEWVRVRLVGEMEGGPDAATPLPAQGSHMLSGLAQADALLVVPAEDGDLPAGALVAVLPLVWG